MVGLPVHIDSPGFARYHRTMVWSPATTPRPGLIIRGVDAIGALYGKKNLLFIGGAHLFKQLNDSAPLPEPCPLQGIKACIIF